jgi:chromosome segregation ATPase
MLGFNKQAVKVSPAVEILNDGIAKVKAELIALTKEKNRIKAGNDDTLFIMKNNLKNEIDKANSLRDSCNAMHSVAQKNAHELEVKLKEVLAKEIELKAKEELIENKTKYEIKRLRDFENELIKEKNALQEKSDDIDKFNLYLTQREKDIIKSEGEAQSMKKYVEATLEEAKNKLKHVASEELLLEELNRDADKRIGELTTRAESYDKKDSELKTREQSLVDGQNKLSSDRERLTDDILSYKVSMSDLGTRIEKVKNAEASIISDREKLDNIKKALMKENEK